MTKLTNQVLYIGTQDIDDLGAAIDVLINEGAKSILLFLTEASAPEIESLDKYLKALPVPVIGGLFPQIIHGVNHYDHGALIFGINFALDVNVFPQLSTNINDCEETLAQIAPWLNEHQSFLVLVDGLSANIDPFIEILYDKLGPSKTVAGGGAGSLSLRQQPCLLSNQGVLADAALLVAWPNKISIGVSHGWQKVAGPFLVTSTQGNEIHTLDYRPAFELYKEIIESQTSKRFDKEGFFSIAKTFPFGMERLDQEILIRDPIATDNGALICVGRVPENTLVYLMKGVPEALIASAGKAAHLVIDDLVEKDYLAMDCVLFDCISRVLFLEDRFEEELECVVKKLPPNTEVVGALTLGEIASSPWGGLQFLNKTTVVCGFSE